MKYVSLVAYICGDWWSKERFLLWKKQELGHPNYTEHSYAVLLIWHGAVKL